MKEKCDDASFNPAKCDERSAGVGSCCQLATAYSTSISTGQELAVSLSVVHVIRTR